MVKLTEEMVIARTRNSDFSNVKKLNCWGTELTDVSILRKMKNVQVLSLSVNNIESLADFQYCTNLQDLFVRKNNIKDLNQVCYLQTLPNLRNLWLGENPCAETEGYRLAVLRALPNLEKLDDKDVMIEEVQTAMQRGRVLIHPLDVGASLAPQQQSQPPSPEDEIVAEYIEEPELERHRRYSSSSDQKSYEEQQTVQEEYRDTDRRNANYNSSPQYLENNKYSNNEDYDDRLTSTSARQNGDYDERRTYTSNYDNSLSRSYVSPRSQYPPQIESAPIDDRRVPVERNNEYEDSRIQHPIEYEDMFTPQVQVLPQLSSNTKRNSVHQSIDRDDTNKMQGWVRHSEKEKCRSQFHYHRRPVTRNSNILSAVLCLVKELDYPSLEVVEMAVRNRMDELEE